ncbi:homeodomain-interacting protein kinase 1-like [Sparus aurata]|uniref:homeodomain-interacting protein kinase 1-like n=1 Tax=Sparus aurata TaxID=8175 RepID=UPI0011C0F946|nr:homeodomain-interacting protein kinase 1-like [Sparus aurata]XP_030280732.1 homeodomain-interacting protein kinase 1-like [Sparus aurata]XP_030280733.1 homeodomain-interacting protein kinase 1-like [Sparus aurata]
MGSSVSNESMSSSEMNPVQLPSGYEFQEVLGEGCFGEVLKCWKKDIKQTVAVKIPKFFDEDTVNEVSMLRRFKRLKLDRHNIVEFIDCFQTKHGKAIVLEMLDISLGDYLEMTSFAPMLLSDIRSVIQQMGTAFEALKGIGVIHGDVHLFNIMMENHQTRPLRVKLIDFGGAISTSEATQGKLLQPLAFRSPEIILGCPFSEAIDMWSLGCLMFIMICSKQPFSGCCGYEILRSIIDLLGQPADLVLSTGLRTKKYFNWTESNSWELKTSFEYFRCHLSSVNKDHNLQSLDDLKEIRLEENNEAEAAEREQCIELLKAMLKMNEDERITPREVLIHPFFTKDYPNNGALAAASPLVRWKPMENLASALGEPATTPLTDNESAVIQPDGCMPSPKISPAGVIQVRPATAENTLLLEGQGRKVSFQSGLNETSCSSMPRTESSMESSICEDPGSCENMGAKKPQKKKNCFRRVFSWMRKTFRLCVTSVDALAYDS